MKVLICIPCLLTGGTEIQTLSLVHTLVKGGHEVMTVCYFEHADDMKKRFESAGSAVVLLCPDGTRPAGIVRTTWTLFVGLRRVVRLWKPDVAHVQYMAPGALPIILLRLLGVRKVIATAHTTADIYGSMGLKLLRFLQSHLLVAFTCITERAERSFFGSSQLLDGDIETLLSPCGKLPRHTHLTIYNSLPYDMRFTGERKPLAEGDMVTIGVVSRLAEIKGMDLVVPAFAKVHNRLPRTQLIVVGEGDQESLMHRQATELLVADCITWAGRQPQSELYKWYGEMDIVLMPSRSEGFGLTAIEAMANGCVVVAADVGGLPEVVLDRETGLLHRPESVDDLAEKICLALEDYSRFNVLRENARRHGSEYSFERYSRNFLLLYGKLYR